MTRQLAPARAPRLARREDVIVLLLDALQKLADTGEVDAACRIAGKACVVLRQTSPEAELRFNALLHRVTGRATSEITIRERHILG